MNILISSAGRRGALVRLAQTEAARFGGSVFATDSETWSAACRLADGWDLVPRCKSPDFVEQTLAVCRRRNIQLLIPTIDTELPIFATHRQQFEDAGIKVAISGPETIAIGYDKIHTHRFFAENQLPVVQQYAVDPARPDSIPELPVIIKPRHGSASKGVQRADDTESFWFYYKRCPDPIVQRVAKGNEYTINFFVDRNGRCITAVPHRRHETRGGEVSKCIVVPNQNLIECARQITRLLPDAWGPMCFQAFLDDEGAINIIELNTRFGGGYPIAHATGANFIRWLINDVRNEGTPEPFDDWNADVAMLRWDDAIFTTIGDVVR